MRELIRYLICGLLTTVVSLSSYYAASMILDVYKRQLLLSISGQTTAYASRT